MTEAPVTKPSGSFWTGNIPADWTEPNLRYVAAIRNGSDYKEFQVDDGGYPVIGSGGVFARTSEYLHDGESVLLGRKGTVDKPLYVNGRFWTVDTMFYTNISTRVSAKFLHYFATTIPFDYFQTSTAVPSMTQGDLGSIKVPVPTLDRQCEIVDFLDRETAQIDELIGKQERLMELLAERRRATINEAYATEASPAKLRHVVQFAQTGPFGTQLSAEEYVEDGVPVINPTHIRNGEITPDLTISVTPSKAAELTRHRLMKGDIILGRKGEVDKSARATHDSEGFICGSDSMLLRPKTSTDSDYLWWFFQSPEAHAQLELWSVGSTVTGLNQTTLSKIRLPFPSLAEQRAVAHLLADATRKIDRLIEKTAQSIELLRERRSALISAAVTGKIDVTNGGDAA